MSVTASFAIILIDLSSRAALDKLLALSGGPATVALWAQLQSVVELVSGVALAGVLQGLTVMIAQANSVRDESLLLRHALKLGFGTSLVAALIVVLAAPTHAFLLAHGKLSAELFWLAAATGCIAIVPATLNAYWLGSHQQHRMLILALFGSVVLLLVSAGAVNGLPLRALMLLQCLALALGSIAVWCHLRTLMRSRGAPAHADTRLHQLMRFVPVGVVVGVMSPVSLLLVRGVLSDVLSWADVGYLQALWRASEWVTATAAGVMSLIFYPRLSASYATTRFKVELRHATLLVLIPAAVLLLLIFLNQRSLLALLYDARFAVSDETAALFMLGSWLRIASWLYVFGLFAAHRTRLIMAGECLSLPLYALLLWGFSQGMTLERCALLYSLSYFVYLAFNVASLTNAPSDSERTA